MFSRGTNTPGTFSPDPGLWLVQGSLATQTTVEVVAWFPPQLAQTQHRVRGWKIPPLCFPWGGNSGSTEGSVPTSPVLPQEPALVSPILEHWWLAHSLAVGGRTGAAAWDDRQQWSFLLPSRNRAEKTTAACFYLERETAGRGPPSNFKSLARLICGRFLLHTASHEDWVMWLLCLMSRHQNKVSSEMSHKEKIFWTKEQDIDRNWH